MATHQRCEVLGSVHEGSGIYILLHLIIAYLND